MFKKLLILLFAVLLLAGCGKSGDNKERKSDTGSVNTMTQEEIERQEAIKKVGEFKPHLVILDLKLPGMDGFQVCKKIRSMQGNEPKILAITGYGAHDTRERILNCGANEYLTKPFDLEKFMNAVNNL